MKSDRSYRDAAFASFWSFVGIFILVIWMLLFSGCYGTYYISDSEYSDVTRPTYRPKPRPVKPNLVTNIREHDNTIIYVKPNRNNNVKTNKSNVKVNTRKPKNTRKPR